MYGAGDNCKNRKDRKIIMTFSNQTNRVSATGSGTVGQEVPFLFPISATTDLTVIKRVTATGVETNLAETTNYTVVFTGDAGGTLTTVTAIETTEQIHIIRNTPNTQALDLEQGGSFNADNIEDALDKNTKLTIENKDKLTNKALTIPETDATSITTELPSSVDRASKVLSFDSSGNATASSAVPTGSVSFTTFGTNMAEAANAAAGKILLNLDNTVNVQDAPYSAVGDGTTDDHDAFEDALATNKTVFVPYTSGGYLINGTAIRQTTGNMILIGDERRPTIKTTDEMQIFNPDGCDYAVFKNLILEGTSGTAGDGGVGLNLEGGVSSSTTKIIIDNIYCTGFSDYGIRVAHPASFYATNLEVTDSGYSGFVIVNGAGPYIIDGIKSYSNAKSGVTLELTRTAASTTGGFQNITLKNITCYSNGAHGVSIGTGTGTTTQLQTAGYYYDTAGQTDNMGNIRLENVQTYGNTESGVLIRGFEVMMNNIVSRENTEWGFIIYQPYVGYAPIVNMKNCFAIKNTLDGFYISGDTTLKTIVIANDCRAKDNTRYGFWISSGAVFQYLLFSNCEASGNSGTGGSAPFDVHSISSHQVLMATNNCIGFAADGGRHDIEMHSQSLPYAAADLTHIRIPKNAILRKIVIQVDTADTGLGASWRVRQSDASEVYGVVSAAVTGYREILPINSKRSGDELKIVSWENKTVFYEGNIVTNSDIVDFGYLKFDAFNDGIQLEKFGTFAEDGAGTVYVEYWYAGLTA